MKYMLLPGGQIECEHELCHDIHDSGHKLNDMLPEDTFRSAVGWMLCIGCGHNIPRVGVHQDCKGILAARVATRFGMIPGEHHKQYVIDQMLIAILGKDKYEQWLQQYNHVLCDPWDTGIAP